MNDFFLPFPPGDRDAPQFLCVLGALFFPPEKQPTGAFSLKW